MIYFSSFFYLSKLHADASTMIYNKCLKLRLEINFWPIIDLEENENWILASQILLFLILSLPRAIEKNTMKWKRYQLKKNENVYAKLIIKTQTNQIQNHFT